MLEMTPLYFYSISYNGCIVHLNNALPSMETWLSYTKIANNCKQVSINDSVDK